MSPTPESIGAAAALDAWECRGRSLVLRPKAYHEAISALAERCDGFGLLPARRAFDKRLAELAADASVIIRPKLTKPRRSRRRRT